jgi:hypothetical protein
MNTIKNQTSKVMVDDEPHRDVSKNPLAASASTAQNREQSTSFFDPDIQEYASDVGSSSEDESEAKKSNSRSPSKIK